MHLFLWTVRSSLFFVLVMDLCLEALKEVVIFEPSFLLGIKAIEGTLDHLILSHMNFLGLLHNLPDVVPLKLLLIVLKDVLGLKREQNISPFDDMSLDIVNFDKLDNGLVIGDLLCCRSFLAKSKGILISLLSRGLIIDRTILLVSS